VAANWASSEPSVASRIVVGKMLIGSPLLKAFIPYMYDASRRPLAHRRKGYSPECLEVEFSEVRIHGVLGSSSPRKFRISLICVMRLVPMLASVGGVVRL
jgi:hypothetical protein